MDTFRILRGQAVGVRLTSVANARVHCYLQFSLRIYAIYLKCGKTEIITNAVRFLVLTLINSTKNHFYFPPCNMLRNLRISPDLRYSIIFSFFFFFWLLLVYKFLLTERSMRFLIILAAALAVTWAGSYGGRNGPRVAFNAHSLDIPVTGGGYMGVQGMRGVGVVGGRGSLGGAVGGVGLSTGLRGGVMTGGSLGVMDDTYLTGTAGLAGDSMGLLDTDDMYYRTGGGGVYDSAIYDGGDGGYDLDYNLVGAPAMQDNRVTVLTRGM